MTAKPFHASDQPSSMPGSAYLALLLTPQGDVVSTRDLQAENDEEAVALAKSMVNGHAIELWSGLRFIEHFQPMRNFSRQIAEPNGPNGDNY